MTKTVNYTPEQVDTIAQRYTSGDTVQIIADDLGKSVRSVTAKLAQLGLYKTQPAKPRQTTKADLIATIEGRYAQEPGTFAELEKLTKHTLQILACED